MQPIKEHAILHINVGVHTDNFPGYMHVRLTGILVQYSGTTGICNCMSMNNIPLGSITNTKEGVQEPVKLKCLVIDMTSEGTQYIENPTSN